MKYIKDIEKEYKISFNCNSNMLITTWLKRKGLKDLSKALKKIQQ